MDNMNTVDIRVFYSKTEMVKYTSHLDISRLFARALRRAGLDVWYSQGFNPHIYMTFSQPLPLGFESLCESFDFRHNGEVDFDAVRDKLNPCLPQGITVLKACPPKYSPSEIEKADYTVKMYSNNLQLLYDKAAELLSQEELYAEKKSKKGITSINVIPFISNKHLELAEDFVQLDITLPAGINQNLNPTLITGFLEKHTNYTKIIKKNLICKNGENFR